MTFDDGIQKLERKPNLRPKAEALVQTLRGRPEAGPPSSDIDAFGDPRTGPKILDCALLVAASGFTRYLCRSHLLYDIDSVNFALAMDHFDPVRHQPHPPGYFLYVCLARLVNHLFHDANTSLVTLSILASCGAVALIYLLARDWFGRRAGLFAGAIFLLSPLCWFHGTVALTYIVEAFFSALIGYLCWRAYAGAPALYLRLAAVALSVAAGFRPSSLLFLGPLGILAAFKATARTRAIAVLLLAITLLTWMVPMIAASGGPRAYFGAFLALWRLVPGQQSFLTGLPAMVLARGVTTMGILALCFGFALPVAFTRVPRIGPLRLEKAFLCVWILPALLFFLLVFLKFVNSGYFLVLTPPLFAWFGERTSSWYFQDASRAWFRKGIVSAAALANIAVFCFAPLYCSFGQVRSFEAQLTEVVADIRRSFRPADTLIVGFDSHFLGYRHAAYYLPEFLTVQYPAVRFPDGLKIFAVEHRQTDLLREIPARRFQKFIFFPLPQGNEYREYMERQKARFPRGTLRVQGIPPGFLAGAITDLAPLFAHPQTAIR